MPAQAARGPFELEISGSGANGPNFNGFTAAANGSIGYFFSDAFEVSLRQSAAYSDIGGVGWDASTRVAFDLHVPLGDQGQIVPFVGVNGGYTYGKNVHDTWEAAPEAGIKFFVNASTFIFVSAEYQFFVDQHSGNASGFGNQLRNGQFVYGLGLGFRF